MREKIQCKPGSGVTKGEVRIHVMEVLGTRGGTAPSVLKISRRGDAYAIRGLVGLELTWKISRRQESPSCPESCLFSSNLQPVSLVTIPPKLVGYL